MAKATQSQDVRRSLTEKVLERVAGHGISRSAVDDAVRRVVESLGDRAPGSGAPHVVPGMIVAISARSLPDLASRVRRDLESEGVVIQEIGIGAAGQHTVVTLRVPVTARQALDRVVERGRYSMSYLSGERWTPAAEAHG